MYFRIVLAHTTSLKNNVIKFFNKGNAKNNKSYTVTDCQISLFCNLNISKLNSFILKIYNNLNNA